MDLNQEIRALSWKEPFGSLMLHGKIETRKWATKYRGLVLMCASKKGYSADELKPICGKWHISRIGNLINKIGGDEIYGSTFAVGNLSDCRQMEPKDEEKCFVKYNPNLFCHIYENVQPIVPFQWKGSQGWRILNDEQKQKIKLLK